MTGVLIVIGLVLVGLFVRRQLKLPVPMLKVDILKTRKYATTVVIIVIVQAALMGTGVITPLYIQGVCGYSATMSGVAMLPGAVIGAFMGLVSGRLFDRFGVRKVVSARLPRRALRSLLPHAAGYGHRLRLHHARHTILTIGLQFTMTPLNTWGVNALSNDVIQHAQGLSNTLNQVAASLGTAMLVSIWHSPPVFAPESAGIEQMFIGDHWRFAPRRRSWSSPCSSSSSSCVTRREKEEPRRSRCRPPAMEPSITRRLRRRDGGRDNKREHRGRGGCFGEMQYHVSDAMNLIPCRPCRHAHGRGHRAHGGKRHKRRACRQRGRQLVGFISDGDVASTLAATTYRCSTRRSTSIVFEDDSALTSRLVDLLNLDVMDIATKRVISVREDTPLDKAVHTLSEKRISRCRHRRGRQARGRPGAAATSCTPSPVRSASWARTKASGKRLSSSELQTTLTLDRAMAAPASAGAKMPTAARDRDAVVDERPEGVPGESCAWSPLKRNATTRSLQAIVHEYDVSASWGHPCPMPWRAHIGCVQVSACR